MCCTACHPKKRHQPVLAAQVAQPGLPQQAEHRVRARLVSRARAARCEELPRVTGLSPGSHLCSVPAAGSQGWAGRGAAPAELWLQGCAQGVHGARVTLVFCRLWGCTSAQDAVSILLFSLVVLCCNLPADKCHFSTKQINWTEAAPDACPRASASPEKY